MAITHDEEKLQDLAEQWQTALRLRDWDVDVRLARAKDMSGKGDKGECSYNLAKKHAVVKILDPRDYKDDFAEQDHEYTLVHELLHLHFAGLDAAVTDGKLADLVLEQGIHACATLMTELLRAMQAAQAVAGAPAERAEEVATSARKPRRRAAKQQESATV